MKKEWIIEKMMMIEWKQCHYYLAVVFRETNIDQSELRGSFSVFIDESSQNRIPLFLSFVLSHESLFCFIYT
jgi:hypothetical protein